MTETFRLRIGPVFHSVSVVLLVRWSCCSNSRAHAARGNYCRFAYCALRHSGRKVLISSAHPPPEEPVDVQRNARREEALFSRYHVFFPVFFGEYLSAPHRPDVASVRRIFLRNEVFKHKRCHD